jgi:hypothetical protein
VESDEAVECEEEHLGRAREDLGELRHDVHLGRMTTAGSHPLCQAGSSYPLYGASPLLVHGFCMQHQVTGCG